MKRYGFLIVLLLFSVSQPVMAQQSDSARTEYIQGSTAFELGNYQEALIHLKKSLKANPDNAMANFTLGQTYEKVDSLPLAVTYIQKAIQQKPNEKSFYIALSEVYKAMSKDQKAVEALNKASQLDPDDTDILFQLARLQTLNHNFKESNRILNKIMAKQGPDLQLYYLKYNNFHFLGNRDSVIAQLEGIRRLDPKNADALQALGRYYLDENQTEMAKKLLKQADSISPGDPTTARLLSGIYINESKWDSARAILTPAMRDTSVTADQKAELVQNLINDFNSDTTNTHLKSLSEQMLDLYVEYDNEDTHALTMAARFYMQTGNDGKAIDLFRKSLDQDAQNDENWFRYVQLLYTSGRYKEAIDQGIRATQYVPGNAFIDFIVGSSYTFLKEPEKAVSWLRKATQQPSRDQFKSIVFASLADAYSSQRNWEPADSAYEQAIRLDPDNDNALNNYAYYLSTRGSKLEYAREMAKKALKIRPANPSYLDTMGWIYYKLGQYNDALKYVDKATQNDNTSADVMEHMGDIYQKLNDRKKAVNWWRKALKKDPSRSYLKKKISSN